MSLDYLMKKVWHPGSMKNIQKVWDQEQKQRDIMKKAEEMKKKLEEERHYDEIRRLQVKAGQLPASLLERLDWMYQYKGNAEKTAEQYLLGKKIIDGKVQKEVKYVTKQEITNQLCEDFFKVHEDPLFKIRQAEAKARKDVENNPLKMRQIYDSVEYKPVIKERPASQDSRSDSSSSRNRTKKERKQKRSKKEKKSKNSKEQKKHRKHKRSRSRSERRSDHATPAPVQRQRSRDAQHASKVKEQRAGFNQLLKQKYGSIAETGDDGRVRLNFNKYRSQHKTHHQQSEQEKRDAVQKMMEVGRQVYDQTINR